MRIQLLVVAMGGVLLAASGAGAAQSPPLPLELTNPTHQMAPTLPPEDPQYRPPRVTAERPRMVFSLPPDGLTGLAVPSGALSELCRRLAFLQTVDGFYWARGAGRSYGVAFVTGGSLDDPRKQAKPGKVYFFKNQDANCEVWEGDLAKLRPYYQSH